jgi:hypothetical protein
LPRVISKAVVMSASHQRRLRLSSEIARANHPAEAPCNHCFLEGIVCYVMPDSRLKCAECTRLGQACVNMSWESLDRTREEYQKKVDDDEKLLAAVISRLLRNKKILKQAEERARKKALCLASDMEAAGETEAAQELDCPAASIGMAFSPAMWATMGLIDASVAEHGTSEGAVGSS